MTENGPRQFPASTGRIGLSPAEHDGDLATLVDRARALVRPGERHILGLTGAPGAGKSTLATTLIAALGSEAVMVPMDGFHLASRELVRLERRDRKGAIDTFDAAGYVALLRRLRDSSEAVVYAPEFVRELEEPIAGAIAVPSTVPLVITEGNYLLIEEEPWTAVRGLLDEVWYLEPGEDVRIQRLIGRHVAYGKPPDLARSWSLGSDQRNAELIAATRHRADLVVRVG
ncbi:nucleoside/nucleotide kinase family protein [Arenibaculum pallidiluteum]|uniref:nucleoside/nucleotide kinase family protein n=1 Tax=Arenibaculum pallidiluteum TaxID=2812559 RepID=UPI001A96E6D1|nr:nucleoside/nucleotide kinase family protein [Arenibaculum pallidiluteum]